MAHREFGKKKVQDPSEAPPEPITFAVAYAHDLRCRQRVNGKLLIELVGKVESRSVKQQSEGILSVFDVCVLTDDGDDPAAWTGKRFDPEEPLRHHTQLELDALAEDYAEDRDEAEQIDDDEKRKEALEAIIRVEPGIDPTSSLGRLNEVLDDPETEIEVEELAEMVGWLVEQYTGRPTRSASPSRAGSRSTRRSSRRGQRLQVVSGGSQTPDGAST